MRKLVTICAVLGMVLAVSGVAQAALQTYSIVDYSAWQLDKNTGLTDHVSGTIIADPITGVIDSASFTITGTTSYTVASATFDSYYVHISPTQITVTSTNNNSPYGYGDLRLSGSPSGSPAFGIATLEWYTPQDPWIAGNNVIASYTGAVYNSSGKARGAEFGTSVLLYPPQAPSNEYPTWVVATVVPEPATMCLLGLGAFALRRKK